MSSADTENTLMSMLQEMTELLHELKTWTRVLGYTVVKQTLETVLDSDGKKLVYQFSDGRRSHAEISDLADVNIRFVSEWGQEWERIGIVSPSRVSSVKGRRQRAFDLADFGFDTKATATTGQT